MKLERITEIETNDIRIGDRISVGHYTATCQEVTPKGALFLFDQYICERGELKSVLQSEEVLNIFKDIREHMVPFDNGDLLKAPFGYSWRGCGDYSWAWFRPIFLISLREDK